MTVLLNFLVSLLIDNKVIWNFGTYIIELSLKDEEGMGWTTPWPGTKEKDPSMRRTKDFRIIWHETSESITQGEEDWPGVRKACIPECAKVAVGILMLDHKDISKDHQN